MTTVVTIGFDTIKIVFLMMMMIRIETISFTDHFHDDDDLHRDCGNHDWPNQDVLHH
jgi:hypothetical protein